MSAFRDKALLHQFRLCRADVVTAMGASDRAPHPDTLRELAHLQLTITAIEQVIRDKQDPVFVRALGGPDPTDQEESAHAA
jgi:hypothetical protein